MYALPLKAYLSCDTLMQVRPCIPRTYLRTLTDMANVLAWRVQPLLAMGKIRSCKNMVMFTIWRPSCDARLPRVAGWQGRPMPRITARLNSVALGLRYTRGTHMHEKYASVTSLTRHNLLCP